MDASGFDFNLADAAIAAILLVSGGLAFFRGAVREMFSIAAWVGAAAATYYGFGAVQAYTREMIETAWIADALAGAAIFLITLIVISWLSSALSRRVKESRLGALDRSLGFLFGLARGALIVSIIYLLVAWAVPPDEQPDWMLEAKARPLVLRAARLVALAIPPEARAEWIDAVTETDAPAIDPAAAFETLIQPPPVIDKADQPGYNSRERKELERLIQTTQ